jgi:hypothetical protein
MKRISSYLVVVGIALTALNCAPAGPEPLRFTVMTFSHETCTFCPGGDVDIADWTRIRSSYVGDEALSVGGYVREFVAAARNYHGVELVGLESPAGVYGGSSRS